MSWMVRGNEALALANLYLGALSRGTLRMFKFVVSASRIASMVSSTLEPSCFLFPNHTNAATKMTIAMAT